MQFARKTHTQKWGKISTAMKNLNKNTKKEKIKPNKYLIINECK